MSGAGVELNLAQGHQEDIPEFSKLFYNQDANEALRKSISCFFKIRIPDCEQEFFRVSQFFFVKR